MTEGFTKHMGPGVAGVRALAPSPAAGCVVLAVAGGAYWFSLGLLTGVVLRRRWRGARGRQP